MEFEQSVKLDFEREMLGTYISDHPLYEVVEALNAKTDGAIVSIRERAEELARSNKAAVVGGILAEVQIRQTKANKPYARVILEDLGGSLEVNFSVSAFETLQRVSREGHDRGDEGPRLRQRRRTSLERRRRRAFSRRDE